MGMFDTAFVRCPSCYREIELQSKADKCLCYNYNIYDAPPSIQADLAGAHECPHCAKMFIVTVQTMVGVTSYG